MSLGTPRVGALVLVLLGLAAGTRTAEASAVGVTRGGAVTWSDAGPDLPEGTQVAVLAGDPSKAGPFTIRIKFPARTKVMPHTHPATEHVTVVQGRMGIGDGATFDESKLQWLTRGDVFWVEKDAPHYGMTKSVTVIEIHATGPWGLTYVDGAGAGGAKSD